MATETGDDLGSMLRSLSRVAQDPGKLDELYATLGEYCHLARNRLNSLKLSLYLARRHSDPTGSGHWAQLEGLYNHAEGFLEQLQTICRPMRLAPVTLALGLVLDERRRAWEGWLTPRRINLVSVPPRESAVGSLDPSRLAQGLDAWVRWRGSVAREASAARMAWWAEDDRLHWTWEEPDARTLEDEAARGDRPASLAWPLLARIVAAHGGSSALHLNRGLRLDLSWPIDAPAPR